MVRTTVEPERNMNIDELLGALAKGEEPVIVERGGKPVAVLIAPSTYERLLVGERDRDWGIIDRLRERNADKDPIQVYTDVTAEIEAARRDRRARDE